MAVFGRVLLTAILLMVFRLHLVSCKAPLYKAKSQNKISEQYFVMLKDGIDLDYACSAIEKDLKGEFSEDNILHKYRTFHGFSAHLSQQLMEKLLECNVVEYVEEDQKVEAKANPTPLLPSWGLDRVDQRDLPLNNGSRDYIGNYGAGVHVYIVDTGVDYNHPDFAGRTGDGFDAFNKNGNGSIGQDCQGHGTHCAGTAVGSTYGVAIYATVHDVTVLGCDGSGTFTSVLEGFEWVAENHTKPAVASVSLGGGFSQADNDAVKKLFNSGVVVVTAAGNDAIDACESSPGSASEAINVGAVTIDDNKVWWSDFGRCVDIFAPGVDIPSANYLNYTEPEVSSGTSMACPHVAGSASVLLSMDSTLTPQKVTDLIVRGATRNKVVDKRFLSPNRLLYIGVETCMTGCGSLSDKRSCQCDADCVRREDCCHDYTYLCWDNTPTCSGRCEETTEQPTYPCQCDVGCYSRGDCCDDYALLCRPNLPCDNVFELPGNGVSFYSPYYPDNYLANQTCRTLIGLPPQHLNESSSLIIRVADFDLEDSADCSHDSLTFYDGDSDDSPVLGRYCGSNSPVYILGGDVITSVFETNADVSNRGYKYVVGSASQVTRDTVETPGVIMSQNFSYSNYSNNEFTITTINAPPGEHVLLNFTHFDVEGWFTDGQLVYCWDTLEFYDFFPSDDNPLPLIGDLIGNKVCSDGVSYNPSFSPLKSRGSSMVVIFQSDSLVTQTGYSAIVTSVKSCDVIVTRPGAISSSTYPSHYYNNERCFTKIRAPRGKQVVITFSDFQLQEPNNNICLDYLKVYNGFKPDEDKLIDVFCGTNAPQIRSIGRNMLLEFASDGEYSFKGYKADVTFKQAVTAKLVGGKSLSEGRVEITHTKYGKGSLCDDNWDVLDGHVACKMLGYKAAKDAPGRAYFGEGNGRIMLSDIDCSGSEYNVDDCQHRGWRPRSCGRRQEAGVICYEKGEVPLPIRLMDGDVYNTGRVEFRIGDEWGTVCRNGFDEKDAEVFCKSAGFSLGVEKILEAGDVIPGNSTQPIFFDGLKCSGDESGIEFCLHNGVGNHDCEHSQDVGVVCKADEEISDYSYDPEEEQEEE